MIDDTIGNKTTIGNMPTMRQYTGSALGRIDQYELLKELGGGGFGTVYLARDTVSGVDVAVKGLPPLVKNNREEMENIRSNFALVSRLHHPNIAAALVLHPAKEVTYAAEDARQKLRVDPGDTLMVMEYAPGVTLSKWRKQFPNGIVPFAKALEITRQIASALDYAHERKIVHRDVKPTNVMVETAADGLVTARVLDFGLAAEVRSSMGRVSREIHDTSGTRPYMAPEQWGGDSQGPATDQYALAATFYELVAGHVPFANAFETGDPMIMITVVTTRQPEMPNGLPESARNALAKALAKKPSDRFASCCDFTAALAGSVSAAHVPAIAAKASPLPHSHIKAAATEEGAKRARAETKIRMLRLKQISDDNGFAKRKSGLNDAFQKADIFFESELWSDAASSFDECSRQVEFLEELDSERKTADEKRKNAVEAQDSAKNAQAEKYTATEWGNAIKLLSDGEAAYGRMDFATAIVAFSDSAAGFSKSEQKAIEERKEAERKAREEAERKAREEAERKVREEAERKAREEAERKAREAAERKAREEADHKAIEEWVRCGKVQLWEGGPYWATKNIGAETPVDYGFYFWWGDTVGYKRVGDSWEASDGSKSGFQFSKDNTPTDGKSISELTNNGWITVKGKGWFSKKYALAPERDAAHVHWGGEWRMPTKQELDDLSSKCDWEWTTVNGVNGYVVRGRGNYVSASIFLPCAGNGSGTSLYLAGSYGGYWSSVPHSVYSYGAWGLDFNSSCHSTDDNGRDGGQSVRPVQGFTQ